MGLLMDDENNEAEDTQMEGLLFLVFWFGCAILHTWYDLKVKHWFRSLLKRSA